MKKPAWIKCSHKTHEWMDYRENKRPGDGLFSPNHQCIECDESIRLKDRPAPLPKEDGESKEE